MCTNPHDAKQHKNQPVNHIHLSLFIVIQLINLFVNVYKWVKLNRKEIVIQIIQTHIHSDILEKQKSGTL